MHKVTVDTSLVAKLGDLGEQIELCDEQGRTLGYYVPASYDPSLYTWAEEQVSVEELERRRQESGGHTTAEILKRLRDQ